MSCLQNVVPAFLVGGCLLEKTKIKVARNFFFGLRNFENGLSDFRNSKTRIFLVKRPFQRYFVCEVCLTGAKVMAINVRQPHFWLAWHAGPPWAPGARDGALSAHLFAFYDRIDSRNTYKKFQPIWNFGLPRFVLSLGECIALLLLTFYKTFNSQY